MPYGGGFPILSYFWIKFEHYVSQIWVSAVIWLRLSNVVHLQLQPVTGHSIWSLNQSLMWEQWPPWRQDWHQVNQLSNDDSFPSNSAFSFCWYNADPEGVPKLVRHRAHRGRGFLHPGQQAIFGLWVDGSMEFMFGLDLEANVILHAIDFPQKLQLTKAWPGTSRLLSTECQMISNFALK